MLLVEKGYLLTDYQFLREHIGLEFMSLVDLPLQQPGQCYWVGVVEGSLV